MTAAIDGTIDAGDAAKVESFLADLIPSVAWRDDRIAIIDQTALPGELAIVELSSVDDVVEAIERLAVRGAPAIGSCGALGMVVGIDEAGDALQRDPGAVVAELADRIGNARPTAVNLSWAVQRVRDAVVDVPSQDVRAAALAAAQQIIALDRQACTKIGLFGRRELADASRILTHCNTGRLATAGWGTALGVLYAKAAFGDALTVLASETRPLLQGARLTAWELADAGIDVAVMPDGASATALHSGTVDAVIVGADRIAANGDTANKIGTWTHAVNAHSAGVPMYVAAPLSTFDPATETGADIEIELRTPDELRWWRGEPTAPADAHVWNPAFDVTPATLITAFITEVGVLRPPFGPSIAAALAAQRHDDATLREATDNERDQS